jgi:hypothetical protein
VKGEQKQVEHSEKSELKRPEGTPTYRVMLDDNFHYMDDSERYALGEFKTLETAIAACRKFVDRDLDHLFKPGMTAKELYSDYTSFGEDPFSLFRRASPLAHLAHGVIQRASEMCWVPPPPAPDTPPTASST